MDEAYASTGGVQASRYMLVTVPGHRRLSHYSTAMDIKHIKAARRPHVPLPLCYIHRRGRNIDDQGMFCETCRWIQVTRW